MSITPLREAIRRLSHDQRPRGASTLRGPAVAGSGRRGTGRARFLVGHHELPRPGRIQVAGPCVRLKWSRWRAADARAVDVVQHAVACRQASRVHAHQAGSDLGDYCLDGAGKPSGRLSTFVFTDRRHLHNTSIKGFPTHGARVVASIARQTVLAAGRRFVVRSCMLGTVGLRDSVRLQRRRHSTTDCSKHAKFNHFRPVV